MNAALLTQKQAAELLNVSPRTMENWRLRGGGPRFARIGHRNIRYRGEDIDRWIAEHTFANTTEADHAYGLGAT